MAGHRHGRVQEDIKRELARLIREEIKDPRLGLVSLTSVEVTNDLKQAKVYYSVLGQQGQQTESQNVLKQASGFLRRELARFIKARTVPELVFVFDPSIQRGSRIAQLLEETKREQADSSHCEGNEAPCQ